MKKVYAYLLLTCLCFLSARSQTLNLVGNVEDAFLKKALKGANITLMNLDSTVIKASISTAHNSVIRNGDFLSEEFFSVAVKAEKKSYLLRASRTGYDDVWKRVDVTDPSLREVVVPPFKMRKSMDRQLGEATVTATKVKMYYKGDTLVYNADAFNLPDGSMLSNLIAQLPGVTINKGGEIFVNGKKIDELLLGSQSFMGGKKEVLLENLPYYTVKHIKVYNQQTDKSIALGYDVEARRYVMDVNLKQAYNHGIIGNVEVAGGTKERWLGRAFALGYTDLHRLTLFGNLNNMGESGFINRMGHFTSGMTPRSLTTMRKAKAELAYFPESKKVKNFLFVEYTSSSDKNISRTRRERFLTGRTPTSIDESSERTSNRHIYAEEKLILTAPFYLRAHVMFNHEKRSNITGSDFNEWEDSLITSMRTSGFGHKRNWDIKAEAYGAFNVGNKKKHVNFSAVMQHKQNESEQAMSYVTRRFSVPSHETRINANDVYRRYTWGLLGADFTSNLSEHFKWQINAWSGFSDDVNHDFLYHPDTLLLPSRLDALNAITDANNSYDSHHKRIYSTLDLSLTQRKDITDETSRGPQKERIDFWTLSLAVPYTREKLRYQRGIIDANEHQNTVFFNPAFRLYLPFNNRKHEIRFNADFKREAPSLYESITYRDDSNPLVVKLGNPGLKGNATTQARASYKYGMGFVNHINLDASFNYRHRSVAQSVMYAPETGIYTYKPVNVNGNYDLNGGVSLSQYLDKKERWSVGTHHAVGFLRSVDHTMLSGETESRENIVETLTLQDGLSLAYNHGIYVSASGDFRWRKSSGRMRDFTTLNAFDFNYGAMGRYTIPRVKTTIELHANMSSRRGYGSSQLNGDDFLLNASLSQPFMKGRLIARIDAYDLLRQQSSTRYEVNAQGRTETWRRSLPHYIMLHLVFQWSKVPKEQ